MKPASCGDVTLPLRSSMTDSRIAGVTDVVDPVPVAFHYRQETGLLQPVGRELAAASDGQVVRPFPPMRIGQGCRSSDGYASVDMPGSGGAATITIQVTPNRSVTIPNRSEKKVVANGICT